MTSGGLCVMTPGTTLMQQWSASSWDMLILQVRTLSDLCGGVPYFVNQTPKLLFLLLLVIVLLLFNCDVYFFEKPAASTTAG